ncbi:ABC transporter protein [Arthrobacter sp. Hiyo8]|nr:ABC transporter protein [Arthrobacter sp. Hiyo8]
MSTHTAIEETPGSNATESALKVDGLWKIFGQKSDEIIGTPAEHLSRKELQSKTGCVAAVKNVSFAVALGRSSWSWDSPAPANRLSYACSPD